VNAITPKAFANLSPGFELARTLGTRIKIRSNPERGFYCDLIPHVLFIKLDVIRVEKSPVLILKRHPPMMLLLVLDISDNINKIRLTH
jgi:hypothetical protein